MTAVRSPFLRTVIALDAAVCGLGGLALAFDANMLEAPLGLSPALMQPAGLFLVGYAALLAFLATRPTLPRGVVWGLVAFNLIWALESVALVTLGWARPTTLGLVAVIGQGVAAAAVAEVQYLVLRRAARAAVA
jgi:hypothetical protein